MEVLRLLLFIPFLFTACVNTVPSPEERTDNIIKKINKKYFQYELIRNKNFDIFAVIPQKQRCNCLRVYIEGDGLAWLDSYTISENPTPVNPVGFKLFFEDKTKCKIYLARPCQYTSKKNCSFKYWTNKRFAPEIIDTYIKTFDKIKKRYKNKKFVIIGFSGGGAIAALVSAYRNDIKALITIAGNLNPAFWCKFHKVSQLRGSLNPINYTNKLQNVKQFHFVGGKDKIMPIAIYNSYLQHINNAKKIELIKVNNATHTKGWKEIWLKFLKRKMKTICR